MSYHNPNNKECPRNSPEHNIYCTEKSCPHISCTCQSDTPPDPFGDFLKSQGHTVVDVTPPPDTQGGSGSGGLGGGDKLCVAVHPQPDTQKTKCCDKCHDVYFEKTYPAHTAHDACTNTSCECHMPDTPREWEFQAQEEWKLHNGGWFILWLIVGFGMAVGNYLWKVATGL